MADRAYMRPDAFAVMRYRAIDDPAEVEEVWNSRDGVTPYTILLRSGRMATHADWTTMVPRPDYDPPPGSRVFTDLTPALAEEKARTYATKIWDDKGAEGMLARQQHKSVDDMVAAMTADIRPGEPALVEVPEGGWKR